MRFEQVEGKHAVLETLRGNRRAHELLVAEGMKSGGALEEILSAAHRKRLPVNFLPRKEIDRLAHSDNHQGVIIRVDPYRYSNLKRIRHSLEEMEQDPLMVMLDGVTDPRNLGSVIRTSEAAGVDALLLPRSRSAPVTPVVFHTSAGAVENLAIATVPNLVSVMKELKKMGIWVVGADVRAEKSCFQTDLTGPLALVMGSEGGGLHRLVRETCDILVNIPMFGKVASLNVSVAAAVILFEVLRQRQKV